MALRWRGCAGDGLMQRGWRQTSSGTTRGQEEAGLKLEALLTQLLEGFDQLGSNLVRTTSISGTAFAPNGTLPLYNVAVYVPGGPLAPVLQGVTCDRCGAPI